MKKRNRAKKASRILAGIMAAKQKIRGPIEKTQAFWRSSTGQAFARVEERGLKALSDLSGANLSAAYCEELFREAQNALKALESIVKAMKKSKNKTKLVDPVTSLADLRYRAKTDERYARLLLVAAQNLGGGSQTAEEAYRTLEVNAMETDEDGVVGEINFCRDLV
jgi:hypothetical protein